jgi:hypothetical protein
MHHFRNSLTVILVVAFALAFLPRPQAHAQADKPADPNEPPTTRLTIHPAEPPAIAMKHRLLPRYVELMPGNAAIQYLKIFPEGGDNELKKHIDKIADLQDQSTKDFQVEEARKILTAIGSTTFEYLRLASVRKDCEWDVPFREHDLYAILLPEIQDLRSSARYLSLRARVQIVDGEIDKAIETLRVGYALARNLAKGPTLIHSLVGAAVARMMNERVRDLMQLPNAPNLYWTIAAFPDSFIDTRVAVELEADGVYLVFPQLKDVATAKLTDEQWSLRLAEFGQSLSKWGPFLGTNEEAKRWQEKLTLGLTIAATAAVHYPRAKTDLQKFGWSKEQLDSMAVPQVILLHIGQTYDEMRDSMFKWFHVPYWQASAPVNAANREFADTVKSREILPFASLLLPAVTATRFAVVRLDRELAALRVVEALRFYAARHDGKLPTKLEDIKEVPVPLDPVFGKPFAYKLDGATATLEGAAPEGRSAETGAFRYIITIAEKGASPARQAARPPIDQNHTPGKQIQKVIVGTGKTLIEVTTSNPFLAIGESSRRAKSVNNLKILGLALHNYHDVHKHFPPAASVDKTGRPLLSWRVHILPYVEANDLYRQFKLDEPWDSEHNKKLIEKMPDVYRVPTLPPIENYKTTYLVPVGKDTVFHDNHGTSLQELRDGTSKTIVVVEADREHAVIWTKPDDLQFDPAQPMRGLGVLRAGKMLAAFGDASVRALSAELDRDEIPKLIMRADGRPVNLKSSNTW